METGSVELGSLDATMTGTVAFDFVEEVGVRTVLDEYYAQARKALAVHSCLGAVVGCGAVAEGVLTWALKRNDSLAKKARAARKHKERPVESWSLEVLIDVARELDLISNEVEQICEAIRDY